jgi:hypothetical protein
MGRNGIAMCSRNLLEPIRGPVEHDDFRSLFNEPVDDCASQTRSAPGYESDLPRKFWHDLA